MTPGRLDSPGRQVHLVPNFPPQAPVLLMMKSIFIAHLGCITKSQDHQNKDCMNFGIGGILY